MKPPRTFWIWAGLSLAGCGGDNPQAFIDQWNSAFVAQRNACGGGDHMACQVACQMSIDRQVCDTVRRSADMNDPRQAAWVTRCAQEVTEQGRAACAAAGMVNPRDPLKRLAAPLPPPGGYPPPPPPAVEPPGGTEVKGSLPMEVIRRVVTRHDPRIRACYEGRRAANPNLAGSVFVEFIIARSGRVSSTSISESSVADSTLERCILGIFNRMVFPAPEGGGPVTVTYPLHFGHAKQ